MGYVKLNSVNLVTANTLVDNVVRPLAPVTTEFADTGGTNNGIFISATLQRPVISMSIYITGATHREAHQRLRDVAAKVTCLTPTRLHFEDDGELYYMVVSKGARTVIDNIDSLRLDCSFESVYPWMLGETKRFTVTRGNATQLDVGGNMPTPIEISKLQYITANDSNGLFEVRHVTADSGQRYFRVTIPTARAQRTMRYADLGIRQNNTGVVYYPAVNNSYADWPMTGSNGKVNVTIPASSISGAETTLELSATPRWL